MNTNKYNNEELDKRDAIDAAGAAGVMGGAALTKNIYDKGHLTGRETLWHNTNKKNVSSILEKGLLSQKASDPTNLTNSALPHISESEKANKVYFGRKKSISNQIGLVGQHNDASKEGKIYFDINELKADAKKNRETLKAKVPTWKMKEVDNPELMGTKNVDEYIKKMREANTPLPDNSLRRNYSTVSKKNTATIKGDVGAEYFVKSKNFKRLSASEMADFIKNNKGRFAKGAAGAALGLAAAGIGAKAIYDNHKKKEAYDNDEALEKVATYKESIYAKAFSK
jgi:hypothetical protein